jgi:hypothetical protein
MHDVIKYLLGFGIENIQAMQCLKTGVFRQRDWRVHRIYFRQIGRRAVGIVKISPCENRERAESARSLAETSIGVDENHPPGIRMITSATRAVTQRR